MSAMTNKEILKQIDEINSNAESEDRDLTESEAEETERLADLVYSRI